MVYVVASAFLLSNKMIATHKSAVDVCKTAVTAMVAPYHVVAIFSSVEEINILFKTIIYKTNLFICSQHIYT